MHTPRFMHGFGLVYFDSTSHYIDQHYVTLRMVPDQSVSPTRGPDTPVFSFASDKLTNLQFPVRTHWPIQMSNELEIL